MPTTQSFLAENTPASLVRYLTSSYSPDCDYIDGQVLDRNMGERDHSRMQALLTSYLIQRETQWNIFVLVEQRIRISQNRYRVPDILVSLNPIAEQIVTRPPFLCIEILSPEDRMTRIEARIEDYLDFGVRCVWVIDPVTLQAFIYTPDSRREASNGVLYTSDPALSVTLSELPI